MVSSLVAVRRKLFARFLEIEGGHVAAVTAELDAVSGPGYWYGIPDCDVEKG